MQDLVTMLLTTDEAIELTVAPRWWWWFRWYDAGSITKQILKNFVSWKLRLFFFENSYFVYTNKINILGTNKTKNLRVIYSNNIPIRSLIVIGSSSVSLLIFSCWVIIENLLEIIIFKYYKQLVINIENR